MSVDKVQSLIEHKYPCIIEYPDMDGEYPDTNYEEWLELIDEQLTRINPDDKILHVECRNMGWLQRSGSLKVDAHNLVNKLMYTHGTLTFFYDLELPSLKATLTHHDNPVNGDQFIIYVSGD